MPQDKRLIVTKTVVQKIKKLAGSDEASAEEPIYLEFVVPSILLQREESLSTRIFHVAHPPFPRNGKATVLIVPKGLAHDCSKINKRHGYYDAVVAAEAICRRGDADSEKLAAQVARTFSHFIVDSRIIAKMPLCIQQACAATINQAAPFPKKVMTPLEGLDDPESLSFRVSQAAKGARLRTTAHGLCVFRVGHAGMTAGDLCENAKSFVTALKADFPGVWKFIRELKLANPLVEKIRFMEVNISK